jgi:hypothetical protein
MSVPSVNLELMLAGWQESHNGGAKLTFWLPDGESLEPFKAMTAKKGNTAGQRFMAVLVLLGDDETPQPIPQKAWPSSEPAKPPLGPRAKLAVQLCANPAFTEWLRPQYDVLLGGKGDGWGDVHPETFTEQKTEAKRIQAWTRHALMFLCGCKESRRELDDDMDCARLFEQRIRKPWCIAAEATA